MLLQLVGQSQLVRPIGFRATSCLTSIESEDNMGVCLYVFDSDDCDGIEEPLGECDIGPSQVLDAFHTWIMRELGRTVRTHSKDVCT